MIRTRPRFPAILAALAAVAFLSGPPDLARDRRPDRPAPAARETRVIAVDGEVALVGRDGGLDVVDVEVLAGPDPPDSLGTLALRGTVYDILVWSPGLAFLAAGSDGIVLADFSDPAAPRALLRIETRGSSRRLARKDDVLYVADEIGGVVVVDAARPARARTRRTLSTRNQVRSLALRGTTLAIAEGGGGVRVFDVSRADLPRDDRAVDRVAAAADVLFVGDVLLVADGRAGLRAFVEREPGRWVPGGDLGELGRVASLSAGAGRALAACGPRGLAWVDVTDEGGLAVRASVVLPRSLPAGRALLIGGDRALVAAGIAGTAVIDLSDLDAPRVVRPRERGFEVRWAK